MREAMIILAIVNKKSVKKMCHLHNSNDNNEIKNEFEKKMDIPRLRTYFYVY